MGGHGGLNILPQKRWNVYNFDNREKVRKDEEKAAKEEQVNRQQTRHHDSALRIQQLRRDRGLDPIAPPSEPPETAGKLSSVSLESKFESKHINSFEKSRNLTESSSNLSKLDSERIKLLKSSSISASKASISAKASLISSEVKHINSISEEEKSKSESRHINLFEGIKIFDPIMIDDKKRKRIEEEENEKRKKMMKKMQMKKEEARVMEPEDEKYRLGYGVVGKGVAAPWYAMKREVVREEEGEERGRKVVAKTGKKTVEELREERLKREKTEKEREWALLSRNVGGRGRDWRDRERRQRR